MLHWKIVFDDCPFADATVGIAVDLCSHVALAHAAATQRPIHRIAFESNLRSGAQVDVFAEDAARPDAFGARRDATLARLRAARYDCACDATDCDCVGPIAYDGV